jgi:hypothetical protein
VLIDEARLTRDLAQELQALRVALAEHSQISADGDASTRVLRRMIASRERLLRTSRL